MKKYLAILILFSNINAMSQSSKAEEFIRVGNERYKKQEFSQAATEYNKAVEADPSAIIAKFNQANAVYKQDQKVDAAKLFSGVIKEAAEKDMRNKAWYNKGVILSQQKNLEESIEAYKNALRNDPLDKEARENLQKAMLELKKKPPPPKKEDKKKDNKQEQQKEKKKQSKMSPKEAEQRLKLLQQKEKEVQQRLQKEKNKTGGSQPKDW